MLGLSRWNPMSELASLHHDLDQLFGQVLGDANSYRDASRFAFSPPVDVTRDSDKWQVAMAIPGIAPEQVDITVAGRTVRIAGERRLYGDGHIEPVLREIGYGRFQREFNLPDDIDAEHVEASYRHGMLELSLPLKESAKPRRIVIASAEPKRLKAA
jgi:HSP20 family protein